MVVFAGRLFSDRTHLVFFFVFVAASAAVFTLRKRCADHGGRAAGRDQASLGVELHAKGQTQTAQNFLDLVQGFASDILGAQHLGLGLLDQIADGLNVGFLPSVVG